MKSISNHTFQIDIIKEIIKIRPDAVLMLVGDGELRPSIEKKGSSHPQVFPVLDHLAASLPPLHQQTT